MIEFASDAEEELAEAALFYEEQQAFSGNVF